MIVSYQALCLKTSSPVFKNLLPNCFLLSLPSESFIFGHFLYNNCPKYLHSKIIISTSRIQLRFTGSAVRITKFLHLSCYRFVPYHCYFVLHKINFFQRRHFRQILILIEYLLTSKLARCYSTHDLYFILEQFYSLNDIIYS